MSRLHRIAEILEVELLDILTLDETRIFRKQANKTNYGPQVDADLVGRILTEIQSQYQHRIDYLERELNFLKSLLK